MKTQTRLVMLAVPVLALAPLAIAKDAPVYEKGQVLSMESKSCGYRQKSEKSMTGEILGTDSQNKNTQELLCREYVLQSDRMVYHIRPKDEKHANLLPVGDAVQFRIHKGQLLLLASLGNHQKEREYQVIAMQLRSDLKDVSTAQK